jgi:hypothetical protein
MEERAKKIMRSLVADPESGCRDFQTNEVNMTKLAELAASALDVDHENGPLDDPDHDLWAWAADIASESE